MKNTKEQLRQKRHARIRARIAGSGNRPRLIVLRSLKHNSAQLIDDDKGFVLVSMSDSVLPKKGNKTARAKEVGMELAKKAVEKGITICVFDRNGYKYHGRVKALADGAREGGLKF